MHTKVDKNTDNNNTKRTIYDGINITKRGADILVASLSFLLFLAIVIAVVIK